MANATTYLATPGFQIGPNLAGVKNLTDQCKSVVVTKSREALELNIVRQHRPANSSVDSPT